MECASFLSVRCAGLIVSALFLSSCKEFSGERLTEESERVSVVKFELADPGRHVKSSLNSSEQHVGTLSVFAYSDGCLVDYESYTEFSDMSMELFPDKVYDFYALANMEGGELPFMETDLAAYTYVMDSVCGMSEGFPMCWSVMGYTPSEGSPVSIDLSRLVAKISLNVDCDVEGMAVSSARLVQSPLSVSPFAEGGSRASEGLVDSGDYASENDVIVLNEGGTAVFYMLENMQGTLLPENDDPMLKVPANLSGISGLCTYLEVVCGFEDGYDKEGTMMYRMYLGEDNVTNFDVERNRVLNITLQLTYDGFDVKDSWKVVPDYVQHVISLDVDDEMRLRIGRESALSVSVYPYDASDCRVVWESDDESVATVDVDGVVRGLREGSCLVRAISVDRPEIYDECVVHVENRVEELSFTSTCVSAVLGSDGLEKRSSFNVEAVYSDGSVRDVTNLCEYSGGSVSAYVEIPGVVVHASEGVAVISAEYDGAVTSMEVLTEAFAVSGIELNVNALSISLGDTFTLKFRMSYNDGTCSPWIPYGFAGIGNASAGGWYSHDYGVADVSAYGVVTPCKEGVTEISMTVTDTRTSASFTGSVSVCVTEAYVVDVYVASSPMFCSGNYSLGLMGVYSDGTESCLKADSWTVSSPYISFSDGSAGLQITDEDMLEVGASYMFTAKYGDMTASASMKYGRWVLESGIEKTLLAGGSEYVYRMVLVMCDYSKVHVPFVCRYSSDKISWQSVTQPCESIALLYYYPYLECVSWESYYNWEGVLTQWRAGNYRY